MNGSPSYDEAMDLTDRVELLRQRLEEGKIQFAPHLVDGFKESFLAIRVRDDGLVDPTTVDGRIRALTSALRHQKYRDEAKGEISLADIQNKYFDLLESEFGQLYGIMKQAGATPSQFAYAFAKSDGAKSLAKAVPDLIGMIREFWRSVSDAGQFHLQDMACLKATFGGDIFPRDDQNAVSSAGLYVDTIVLPCPILRLAGLLQRDVSSPAIERLVKHVLCAMGYRSVATADVSPPIAVVLPAPDEASDSRADILAMAAPSIISHASFLFGRNFESVQHIGEFLGNLPTIDDVLGELRRPERLLFDRDVDLDPRIQLETAMKAEWSRNFGGDHAGRVAMQSVVGSR